jgi:hypothetical protein
VGGAGRGRQEGPVGQPAQHQHGGHAGEQLQARSHLQHRFFLSYTVPRAQKKKTNALQVPPPR